MSQNCCCHSCPPWWVTMGWRPPAVVAPGGYPASSFALPSTQTPAGPGLPQTSPSVPVDPKEALEELLQEVGKTAGKELLELIKKLLGLDQEDEEPQEDEEDEEEEESEEEDRSGQESTTV